MTTVSPTLTLTSTNVPASVSMSASTAVDFQEERPTAVQQDVLSTEKHSAEPILEASRLADSQAPDGGYGWVIVISCATLSWWSIGTGYSWGVIQGALIEEGLSTPGVLAFVGSLGPTLLAAVAILNSRLMRAIGARYTAMLGVTVLGLAEILASFAVKSVPGLFITEGVLLGFGFGLSFIVTSSTTAQYFSKKRGLANGIVFASGGFGGAVLSIALDPLIRKAGIAWAFRTLGLAALVTGLPAAWFLKERTRAHSGNFIDWALFKDINFILIFLVGAIGTFPLLVPPFFLPLFAHAIGLSTTTGAGLLAGYNFASAVGRVLCGLLCDKIGSLNTLLIALILTVISTLAVWPVSTSVAPLAVFSIVNGMSNGGFFSTMPTVVGNCFGSSRVAVAMGMVVTGWSGGYLLGAPIAGFILDAYGGQDASLQAFRPAMYYAGALAITAAALVQIVRYRTNPNFFAKV
ncbi:major facilitator superfamily transporter [Xylaria nigripes]|nr:major facilitator superfamily transporter [Xylaria nigripes]